MAPRYDCAMNSPTRRGLHRHDPAYHHPFPIRRSRRAPALRGPRQRPAAAGHRLTDGGCGVRAAGRRAGHRPHRRHLRPARLRRQPVDDPEAPSGVEQRADDIDAILDDLGAESADLFGSSGGAVTGLALVARLSRAGPHTRRPRTAAVGAAARRRHSNARNTEAIIDTFHRDGFEAAWMHFMVNAGFDVAPDDAPHGARPEPSEDEHPPGRPVLRPSTCGRRRSICPTSRR